jgi:hypothetical protein
MVGHEQVARLFMRSGTNEFVFVLPDGLSKGTAPEGTIVLGARDLSYYVSVRLAALPPVNAGTREALQEWIASHYADAKSLEGFTARVADREGTGFQLRRDPAGVGSRLARVLWVPFNAGIMEFALDADAKNASAGQAAMDTILLTFRSNEGGRLEIVKRSDKS